MCNYLPLVCPSLSETPSIRPLPQFSLVSNSIYSVIHSLSTSCTKGLYLRVPFAASYTKGLYLRNSRFDFPVALPYRPTHDKRTPSSKLMKEHDQLSIFPSPRVNNLHMNSFKMCFSLLQNIMCELFILQ